MSASRRFLACAAALLAAVVSFSSSAGAVDDDGVEITSIDTGSYPAVSAVVTTSPGLVDTARTADAFEVLEAGVAIEATVDRLPTDNLEVMLLIDTSGSMSGLPLESEKAAASEFMSLLPPDVRVGVVAYGSTPQLVAAPSTDRNTVETQLAPLTASTDTALYDAVIFANEQFTPDADRRAIVLLTDGEDNASSVSLDATATVAAHVPVHVIELVTGRSDRPALDRLANAGGGTVLAASDPSSLTELYRQTAGTLTNQYRITYTSQGFGPVKLTVRVDTGNGVVSDSAEAILPTPATTTPTTTAPPTSAAATTVPATTAPAVGVSDTTSPPHAAIDAGANPAQSDGSRTSLLVGAATIFTALVLLVVVLMSPSGGDRRRRAVRAGLGLGHDRSADASVSQLTNNLTASVDRILERRGRSRSMAVALEVAAISLRPGEFVTLVFTVGLVAAIGAFALLGPLGSLAVLVIAPMAAQAVVGRRAASRRAKFAETLPDNIQMLTSSLKAGYGMLPALDNVAQEAPEPARSEFRRVLLETRVGRDPSEALTALAERMASPDFEWVVSAIDINREVGGDLASTLENVADTIRERQRLFRQVKTITAEGRLSAYVLTGIPVFLALAMSAINPGYLAPMMSGVGLVLIAGGAVSLLVGWLWMKRLIRIEF